MIENDSHETKRTPLTSSQPDAQPSFEAQMQRSIDDGRLVHKRELDAALEEIAVLKGEGQTTELPPLTGECEGGTCWWNGETGYLEACPKHESQGMEAMMEKDSERMVERATKLPPMDVSDPMKPGVYESEGYSQSNRSYTWHWIYESDFDQYAKEAAACVTERERQLLAAQQQIERLAGTLQEERTLRAQTEAEMTAELAAEQQKVCDFQAASMLDVGGQGGPCRVQPHHVEAHVTNLRADNTRLRDALKAMRDKFSWQTVTATSFLVTEIDAALQPVEGKGGQGG